MASSLIEETIGMIMMPTTMLADIMLKKPIDGRTVSMAGVM